MESLQRHSALIVVLLVGLLGLPAASANEFMEKRRLQTHAVTVDFVNWSCEWIVCVCFLICSGFHQNVPLYGFGFCGVLDGGCARIVRQAGYRWVKVKKKKKIKTSETRDFCHWNRYFYEKRMFCGVRKKIQNGFEFVSILRISAHSNAS